MKPQRERRLERLTDANPEMKGDWLAFDCPIHPSDDDNFCRVAIPLRPHPQGWDRSGDTFDTLTVSPSIARRGGPDGCEWHGFIRGGAFEHCGDSR